MDDRISELHIKLFPEEYDFTQDSISDAKDRRRGINPMSVEYQDKVNKRRLAMGVEPFIVKKRSKFPDSYDDEEHLNNNPTLISSIEYCHQLLGVSAKY